MRPTKMYFCHDVNGQGRVAKIIQYCKINNLFIKKRQPNLFSMSREYAGSREPMKTDFNRGRVKRKYAFIRLLGMCTIGTVQ